MLSPTHLSSLKFYLSELLKPTEAPNNNSSMPGLSFRKVHGTPVAQKDLACSCKYDLHQEINAYLVICTLGYRCVLFDLFGVWVMFRRDIAHCCAELQLDRLAVTSEAWEVENGLVNRAGWAVV